MWKKGHEEGGIWKGKKLDEDRKEEVIGGGKEGTGRGEEQKETRKKKVKRKRTKKKIF